MGHAGMCFSLWPAGEASESQPVGSKTWLWVLDLNTYHSPPVHWETPIRLHDNGAEFHVLGVSTVALWSEPAHRSYKTVRAHGGKGTETQGRAFLVEFRLRIVAQRAGPIGDSQAKVKISTAMRSEQDEGQKDPDFCGTPNQGLAPC